ncbi:dihydrolipoyl dehydrogenase [Chloroflexota bacterium]
MEKRDVVVVGGGPAGYVAAIRASQLGARVALIEEKHLGGTCLNWGCIPTKFMLHAVEVYESIKQADQYGIKVAEAGLDLAKMQACKNRVISTLVSGVKSLMGRNNIEVIDGRAKLTSTRELEVDSGEGKRSIPADKIIIANGSKPIDLPIPGIDSKGVLGTDGLITLEAIPESLLIIGGGVIGVEMATIWAKLGSKVTLVEMMPHCLPTQDSELALMLQDTLRQVGIEILCGSKVSSIADTNAGKLVSISCAGTESKLEVATVAVAVGRQPNPKNLGLEECGIVASNKGIQVNDRMETGVPGIYAAGDVVGGMMLAYVSMAQGKVAAENALGENTTIDYRAVPQCIFTQPEVASVGLTEEEAAAQGYEVRVGRFPFMASGMAAILGERRGMVKMVTETQYHGILGVHIIGPQATNLIMEAALAVKLESTTGEILATMHPHPSLSEALWEAALDVTGQAIHFDS